MPELKKFDALPAFAYQHESGNPTKDYAGPPVWSGKQAPPAIGSVIDISINAVGPATVDCYATYEGYLGVMATPRNPPKWHSGDSALVFGAEIREQR